jgi:hypothetical protein
MDQIVLEIEEFGKTHSEFKIFRQNQIRIGRAFDNDLIINDPFVNAAHMTLKLNAETWECEDNNTSNGTFISDSGGTRNKVKIGQNCAIRSGDTVFIGKTTIRVWDINHPVGPAQALDDAPLLFLDPRKPLPAFLLSMGLFSFLYYLNLSQWSWRKNGDISSIVLGEMMMLLILAIWSGVWALITRFSKHQHRFLQHLIFSFQWCVFSMVLTAIVKYILFFACNHDFFTYFSLLIYGPLVFFILNTHLAIATNVAAFKRGMISCLIVLSIVVLTLLKQYAMHNEFSPRPAHYINIVPVPKKLIPAIPVNEEIDRLDSVFQK